MDSKRLPKGSQRGSKGPKRLPKRAQKDFKGYQNGAQMARGSPEEPKRLPRLQNEAKMGPKKVPKLALFGLVFEARFKDMFLCFFEGDSA